MTDIRRQTVEKIIQHLMSKGHTVASQQVLVAAQETDVVLNCQANKISKTFGLDLKWEENPPISPRWGDQTPDETDRQTAIIAQNAYQEGRLMGAMEAVRHFRGWSLLASRAWLKEVFPGMNVG